MACIAEIRRESDRREPRWSALEFSEIITFHIDGYTFKKKFSSLFLLYFFLGQIKFVFFNSTGINRSLYHVSVPQTI